MKLSQIKTQIRATISESQAYDLQNNTKDTPKWELALGKLAELLSELNQEANDAMGEDGEDEEYTYDHRVTPEELLETEKYIRQAIKEAQAYDNRRNTKDTPKWELALGKLAELLMDLNQEANDAMDFEDDDLDFSL